MIKGKTKLFHPLTVTQKLLQNSISNPCEWSLTMCLLGSPTSRQSLIENEGDSLLKFFCFMEPTRQKLCLAIKFDFGLWTLDWIPDDSNNFFFKPQLNANRWIKHQQPFVANLTIQFVNELKRG
jgi:hypothetical protein